MSRFTVYQTPQSEFHRKLVGSDDRTLAKSPEGFKSREACVGAVSVVKQEVVSAAVESAATKPAAPVQPPVPTGTGPMQGMQGAQGVPSPAKTPSPAPAPTTNPNPGSTTPGGTPKL